MPAKPTALRQVRPSARVRIIAKIADGELTGKRRRLPATMILGDGGVACHELGEVAGVCAEAPLPHILVREQKFFLDGVCGIASMLQHWGLSPVAVYPAGRGQTSSLQQLLMTKEGLRGLALCTGLPQAARHTRRIFAGGHQLAHLETEEMIPAAPAQGIKNRADPLIRSLKRDGLLCIVDKGNAGLNEDIISKLAVHAKRSGTRILYEPRCAQLFSSNFFDVIKVNHNQITQWFGVKTESDRDALAAAKMVLSRTKAKSIIYTRGARGILVYQSTPARHEAFLITSEPKKLFDLTSAGDIVTASLAFCLAKGYSLLQAACFATAAAELSLDQRYDKHFDIRAFFKKISPDDKSRRTYKAE